MSFTNPHPASRLTVDSANSLANGLVGFWPLTDGSGSTAKDITSNANDGTLGATVTWGDSLVGSSSVSDGTDLTGGIDIGNPAALQITGDLTLAAWVKFDDATPVANEYVVSKYYAAINQRAYGLALLTGGNVRFAYQSAGGPYDPAEDVESVGTLTSGVWHFIVGTFESSTAGKVYIDGQLDTSNTVSVPASIFNSSSEVFISGVKGASGPTNCVDGNIQNVRVYNRAFITVPGNRPILARSGPTVLQHRRMQRCLLIQRRRA
jgi:hypothetical protein